MATEHPAGDPLPGALELGGRSFAALFRAIKSVRPIRPIHPRGISLAGELTRYGTVDGGSGLDWLDSPGSDTVEARLSRSIGFPPNVPDILGLALCIRPAGHDAEPADVLFASTGWSFPTRFILLPGLAVAAAHLTTLMPYRGKHGPVLLGLRTLQLPRHGGRGSDAMLPRLAGDWVLGLYFAAPAGHWIQAGELRLRADRDGADTPLRFNPLEHPLPTAETYRWTERLREQSYRVAQRPAGTFVFAPGDEAPPDERKRMSTVTKLFNSPAAEVWKVIADGWLYSGWVVGASRIRAVDAHWPEEGSRLHHSVGAWPLVINDSTRVTAVDPGRSLELIARGWPVGEAKVAITLEDRGTQCLVTIAEDAVRGPGKNMPKVLRDRLIGIRNRETLERLELMAAGGAGVRGE